MWSKEKHEAVRLINNIRNMTISAIKSGRLKRKPCQICSDIKSEAHHSNYINPLKVIFLCRKHHKALHKRLIDCAKKFLRQCPKCKSAYWDRKK